MCGRLRPQRQPWPRGTRVAASERASGRRRRRLEDSPPPARWRPPRPRETGGSQGGDFGQKLSGRPGVSLETRRIRGRPPVALEASARNLPPWLPPVSRGRGGLQRAGGRRPLRRELAAHTSSLRAAFGPTGPRLPAPAGGRPRLDAGAAGGCRSAPETSPNGRGSKRATARRGLEALSANRWLSAGSGPPFRPLLSSIIIFSPVPLPFACVHSVAACSLVRLQETSLPPRKGKGRRRRTTTYTPKLPINRKAAA